MDKESKDKTADLVSDMVNSDLIKPSERLQASISSIAGHITETDRNKIGEMLKSLGKYKNMEENDNGQDPQLSLNKTLKSPYKQDKGLKPESKGLLDFIDAELSTPSDSTDTKSRQKNPLKSGQEIVITPAPTLNNKTNLKALSAAFQNLNFGKDSSSLKQESPEQEAGVQDESDKETEDKPGRRRRPRRKNKGKKQENAVMESESADTIAVGVSENQSSLVKEHDVTEVDENMKCSKKERTIPSPSGAKAGSYSQLLQSMGKGSSLQKNQSSPREISPSPKQQKAQKRKIKEYKGAEMIQIAAACDADGKTKRDIIIATRPGKGKEGVSSQTSSRKSSADGRDTMKVKENQIEVITGQGQKGKAADKKKNKSPKQKDKGAGKKDKEGKRAEQQQQYMRPAQYENEEESQSGADYPTTATVNVRKHEHRFIVGHQQKHLQDIYIITGVIINVPPMETRSQEIFLHGLKSQLGPAIALMFSKSQQAQLEAGKSKSAKARDILLPQNKGQSNFPQGQPNFQGQQGFQKEKSPGANQYGNRKNKQDGAKLKTPPLIERQHSSTSQSSNSEHSLDTYEVKGHRISQNVSQGQQGQNQGQGQHYNEERGQSRRPYGNVGQVNLKGPPLYDQHYTNKGRQQNKGGGGEKNNRQRGRKAQNEEQGGQGGNKGQGKRQRTKKAMFADYISQEELSAGLKRGTLIQGPVRINPKNFEEAYVPHPDGGSDIIICGVKDRNRALNGDIVAIELYEEGEWKLNKTELEDLAQSHKADQSDEGSGSESDSDIVIESVETIEVVNSEIAVNQSAAGASSSQKISQNVDNQSAGSPAIQRTSQNVENQSNKKRESPMKRFISLKDAMSTSSKSVKKLFGQDGSASAKKMLMRTGKVVSIIERKHSRAATGHLKQLQDKCTDKALFCPNDHRLPRIIIPIAECPEKFLERLDDFSKTLFVARIIDWKKESLYADGHLAKSLGEAGEIEPETEGMLIENGIHFDEFSQEVLDCLPKESPWYIPASEFEYRRDFRKSCVFTIDPSTARDLDDALSCEELGQGRYKVGVHIADVSYFVKESTRLDEIAELRATSVYLVQKVVPMLPRLLCEQLCSLNPDVDRLTFSVEWIISENGEIKRFKELSDGDVPNAQYFMEHYHGALEITRIEEEWFGRSVIKSCVKLAYDHAQGFIEHPDKDWTPEELPPISAPYTVDDIKTRVLNLHKIAQNLRKARMDSGSLRLDQVKLSYSLNMETMMPNGCFVYEQKDSNRLVEEFMLLANMAVAHKINSDFPNHSVLRRHPEPQQKMMEQLKDQCSALGIHIDINSAGSLQRSLRNYCGDDEHSMARLQVLVALCAKPMQNAKYFCTGCIDDENLYRHYALNVPLYTHFTSPIRRYPDILVHRLLGASLGYCDSPKKAPMSIHRTAEHCNDKKTAAKRVGDLSGELFFAVFVKTVGPIEEKGMVMAVFDKSFDVFILKFGVSKRVYCDKLPLREKSFKKERKVPSLRLIWKEEEGEAEIEQEISIFSVVDCVMQKGELPLQWLVTIKRPTISVVLTDLTS